ncbi:hypothetical protein [Streptomyces sp. Z26]|uniref:hypothetical protein n=1 Tax=Streptomyces sp. Z26 TaxID=2500177 RepID=UPI000EF16AB0|nr:hypothetical protein [Streptomyces sp. Z26]RLL66973.1 hypothetical protein D7M15_08945 [Streptomyces sp. Z26]
MPAYDEELEALFSLDLCTPDWPDSDDEPRTYPSGHARPATRAPTPINPRRPITDTQPIDTYQPAASGSARPRTHEEH